MGKSQVILREKAKQKLNQLNKLQKQYLIKKYKKSQFLVNGICGSLLILASIGIIINILVLYRLENEPLPPFMLVLYLSLFACCAIWAFFMFRNIKRILQQTDKEVAIQAIIFEFKNTGQAREILQQSQNPFMEFNNTSNTIAIKTSTKEQLKELKEMYADKLITAEEYEQKKKQILGL